MPILNSQKILFIKKKHMYFTALRFLGAYKGFVGPFFESRLCFVHVKLLDLVDFSKCTENKFTCSF